MATIASLREQSPDLSLTFARTRTFLFYDGDDDNGRHAAHTSSSRFSLCVFVAILRLWHFDCHCLWYGRRLAGACISPLGAPKLLPHDHRQVARACFVPTMAFFFLLLVRARRIESQLLPSANFLKSRLFLVVDPDHDDDDAFFVVVVVGFAQSAVKKTRKEPLLLSSWQASSALPAARIEGKNGQRFLLWLYRITQIHIKNTLLGLLYMTMSRLSRPSDSMFWTKSYVRSRKWRGYIRNTTKSRKNAQQTPQPTIDTAYERIECALILLAAIAAWSSVMEKQRIL